MKPHQQRVIDERDELITRTEKLAAFLDAGLVEVSEDERQRLILQLQIMKSLVTVLQWRISNFE
jgi:hypothetical protein